MNNENELRSHPANAWMHDPAKVAVVRQRQEDLDWAMAHSHELSQQYPGDYLVVCRKQVVAHGTDGPRVLQQASAAGSPREELVFVAFPEPFVESPFDTVIV